ncbi:hypothetical protein [Lewinella sp. LCG006]|uniref:hypothetical protein n=1 Tax=Lewinella sp. LCG006 TaxID=3231911 RepID=UPI0034616E4C
MIIWKGLGFLAILIPVVIVILLQIIFGDDPIYASIGYLLGAVPVWFLGKRLNADVGKVVADPQTGQQMTTKAEHTLFWIRMEYAAVIPVIIGIVAFFA